MNDNSYHFRSALGGFHKGDVTAYIEQTAALHRNAILEKEQIINTLREENRSLQQQLNILMMSTPLGFSANSNPTPVPAPAPAPAPTPEPTPEPEPALTDSQLISLELQAYRRAEAVERNANTRVRGLYRQMENLCTEALDEFENTDSAVKETLELITNQTTSLAQAYQALAAALNTSREKLASMNSLISDVEEEE